MISLIIWIRGGAGGGGGRNIPRSFCYLTDTRTRESTTRFSGFLHPCGVPPIYIYYICFLSWFHIYGYFRICSIFVAARMAEIRHFPLPIIELCTYKLSSADIYVYIEDSQTSHSG